MCAGGRDVSDGGVRERRPGGRAGFATGGGGGGRWENGGWCTIGFRDRGLSAVACVFGAHVGGYWSWVGVFVCGFEGKHWLAHVTPYTASPAAPPVAGVPWRTWQRCDGAGPREGGCVGSQHGEGPGVGMALWGDDGGSVGFPGEASFVPISGNLQCC